MARILVNYIYNKAKDEYKILENDCVYADQKVAVLETEEIIKTPLVVPIRNQLTVVDKEQYEKFNKKFHLVADKDGNVMEDPNGAEIWLPKDTDVSKLRFINGQLVMLQDEQEKAEPEKETKNAKESKKEPKNKTN